MANAYSPSRTVPYVGRGVRWAFVDPSTPGYPWERAALHPQNFPTPGLFFDANTESSWFDLTTGFDGIVRGALGSALAMSELDADLATSKQSHARRLRQQMRAQILCAWNLRAYGCTNENYCGGSHPEKPGIGGSSHVVDHMMNESGVGLNLEPVHANNRQLLAEGKPATRTITLEGESLTELSGSHRPLLWIPAVNLDKLRESGVITVEGMRWSDGSSMVHPPPVVQRLGSLAPPGLFE